MIPLGCDDFEVYGSDSIEIWRKYSGVNNRGIFKDVFKLGKWNKAVKEGKVYSPHVIRFSDYKNDYYNSALKNSNNDTVYPAYVWVDNDEAQKVIEYFEGKKKEREQKEKQTKFEEIQRNPQMQQLNVFNWQKKNS